MDFLRRVIDETIKSGLVQAVIAFTAWAYVPVLVLVAIYNAILCIIKRIRSRHR